MVNIIEKLKNPAFWKTLYKPSGPGISNRSQRGLFHGLQPRTGHSICWSDKKHLRWFKPNIHRKKFYSEILRRELYLPVSTKALRCIEKSGGFDNYILYTRPKTLASKMGVMLQELMKMKLRDPSLKIPYIPKASISVYKKKKAYRRKDTPGTMILPKELRHTDISHLEIKKIEDFTPEEKAQLEERIGMIARKEYSIDIEESIQMEKNFQVEIDQLRPEYEKAMEELKKRMEGEGDKYDEYFKKIYEKTSRVFKKRTEEELLEAAMEAKKRFESDDFEETETEEDANAQDSELSEEIDDDDDEEPKRGGGRRGKRNNQ